MVPGLPGSVNRAWRDNVQTRTVCVSVGTQRGLLSPSQPLPNFLSHEAGLSYLQLFVLLEAQTGLWA